LVEFNEIKIKVSEKLKEFNMYEKSKREEERKEMFSPAHEEEKKETSS